MTLLNSYECFQEKAAAPNRNPMSSCTAPMLCDTRVDGPSLVKAVVVLLFEGNQKENHHFGAGG